MTRLSPNDYDRLIAILLAVTLNRKRRDFSERDRLVLTMMQGQRRRAYDNDCFLTDGRPRLDSGLVSTAEEFGLTARERDVALWLSQGKTNAEIGVILGMAPRTAEKHVEAILRKMHAENRTAAAVTLRGHLADDQ